MFPGRCSVTLSVILLFVLGVAIVLAASSPHGAPQLSSTMLNAYTTQVLSLWSVEGAVPGVKVKLWARVQNSGTAALPSNTQVWFWVDGPNWTGAHWVGSASTGSLAANSNQWYSYEWAIPSNSPSGKYAYWAQVFVASQAISDWSAEQDFMVSASSAVPGKATLVSPAGNISSTLPTYTWNAVANSTYYYLWVNDAATMGKIQTWYKADQVGCASGSGTCSITPASTLAAGAGQWWIQTWNSTGYGPWSDGMAFVVGGTGPPGKAILISPTGDITDTIPDFTWKPATGATKYLLYVDEGASQGKINQLYSAHDVGCDSGTANCVAKPKTTMACGASQWWVQAQNASGNGPWSDALSFNVVCGCNLCNPAQVGAYDLQVLASKPANPPSNWPLLFQIGASVKDLLFGQDKCTSHIDGRALNASAVDNGKLRIGGEYAALPPAGPIASLDYIISGTVQGGSAGYQVTIVIGTAYSRENVKSASFSLAYNFTQDQLTAAINKAVADLGPLGTTILAFELAKRNGDSRYALGKKDVPGTSSNLQVNPKDTSLKVGQSTSVDLILVDCDGKPLADRLISLVDETDDVLGELPGTTGGTVSPVQVRTDGSGRASVTFTAQSTPGMGVIKAHSIYLRPPGNKLAFQAEAYVDIEEPYPVWLLDAELINLRTVNQDYREGPDIFGTFMLRFEQTMEQSRFWFRRILHRYDPGYPCMPDDCWIYKYHTGGDLWSSEGARYWNGYAYYNSYKVYEYHSPGPPVDDYITIQWEGHHIDLGPYNSNHFSFYPGDSVLVMVDSQYTEPEFLSEYHSQTGWKDTVSHWTGTDGPSISCKPGDQGAQFTWNEAAGIFGATCLQYQDKEESQGMKIHVENRVFVTLKRIAKGTETTSQIGNSQVKP